MTGGSSTTDHASRSSGDSSARYSGGLGLADPDLVSHGKRSKGVSGGSPQHGRETRDVVRG